jgi:hypothetical protein
VIDKQSRRARVLIHFGWGDHKGVEMCLGMQDTTHQTHTRSRSAHDKQQHGAHTRASCCAVPCCAAQCANCLLLTEPSSSKTPYKKPCLSLVCNMQHTPWSVLPAAASTHLTQHALAAAAETHQKHHQQQALAAHTQPQSCATVLHGTTVGMHACNTTPTRVQVQQETC